MSQHHRGEINSSNEWSQKVYSDEALSLGSGAYPAIRGSVKRMLVRPLINTYNRRIDWPLLTKEVFS